MSIQADSFNSGALDAVGKREPCSGLRSPPSYASLPHRLALLELQSEFGTSRHLKIGIFHVNYGSPSYVEKLEDLSNKDPAFPYTSQKQRPQLHRNVFSGDFPGGPVIKNSPCNAGDTGSIPGPGNLSCHRASKPAHCNY